MKRFNIEPIPGTAAVLEVYLRDRAYEFVDLSKRPFVLICPGGGYAWTADREAEPIALQFVEAGYQAAILRYSVRKNNTGPLLGDTPMQEAAAAVSFAREHANDWGIDPQKITVIGFSAGGHLAGSLGVFWNNRERIPNGGESSRPNAMVLSYAVISGGEKAHSDSIINLSGKSGNCPEADAYSLEKHVGPDTSPAFIWHTYEDDCVPVENALLMANAMQKAHRPYALHLFTHGWHGLSLATPEVGGGPAEVQPWFALCLTWLKSMGVGTNY